MSEYPFEPGFKARDTSAEAAEGMRGRAEILRKRVLAALKVMGSATADEIAWAIGESILAVRPRVSEIVAQSLALDSGLRRKNASGRPAIVWRAA